MSLCKVWQRCWVNFKALELRFAFHLVTWKSLCHQHGECASCGKVFSMNTLWKYTWKVVIGNHPWTGKCSSGQCWPRSKYKSFKQHFNKMHFPNKHSAIFLRRENVDNTQYAQTWNVANTAPPHLNLFVITCPCKFIHAVGQCWPGLFESLHHILLSGRHGREKRKQENAGFTILGKHAQLWCKNKVCSEISSHHKRTANFNKSWSECWSLSIFMKWLCHWQRENKKEPLWRIFLSKRSEEKLLCNSSIDAMTFALFESKKTPLWPSGLIESGKIECWNAAPAYKYHLTFSV